MGELRAQGCSQPSGHIPPQAPNEEALLPAPPPCWVPAGFPGGTYHGGNYIINGVMSCVTCASLTRMQPDEGRGFFICLVLSPNRGDCPDWVPIKHCLDRRADGMGEGLGSGLSALAILTTALKDAAQREA